MSSPNLFLHLRDGIEPIFEVVEANDEAEFCIGEGYEIPDAIACARKRTDEDILCDAGIITTKPAKEFIQDKDELIRALAEIGGMRVIRMLDDNLNFKGYAMELVEWIPTLLFF